jgi:hypothetical protein
MRKTVIAGALIVCGIGLLSYWYFSPDPGVVAMGTESSENAAFVAKLSLGTSALGLATALVGLLKEVFKK